MSSEKNVTDPAISGRIGGDAANTPTDNESEPSEKEMAMLDISHLKVDMCIEEYDTGENIDEKVGCDIKSHLGNKDKSADLESKSHNGNSNDRILQFEFGDQMDESRNLKSKAEEGGEHTTDGEQKEAEPVFDGTEIPGMEACSSTSSCRDADSEGEGPALPGKAAALKNYVKQKSAVAVSSLLRVLSGKTYEVGHAPADDMEVSYSAKKEITQVFGNPVDGSAWNPMSYITIPREQGMEVIEEPPQFIVMRGRIILYTRLGCQNCKEVRLYLRRKRLGYCEINIDLYPGRRVELEKFTASCSVPKVFFNEVLIGGLSELKGMDESGKLEEKIDYLITEAPSFEAPLPPLSDEDDASSSGPIDELALIVRKMKQCIVVKDRFYRMRRCSNCFLGTEAVDFLSKDQYLERNELSLVENLQESSSFSMFSILTFFWFLLLVALKTESENLFEDGSDLYRFLDDDPMIAQWYNIPRDIIEAKPKSLTEIGSRLRFLVCAILEAYTSEDRNHVDYRSIHGSEEFARYLRIIQELQRVELHDLQREEKLAFFINLYNMMAIHAILVLGYPTGPLERRKLFGDFKYVIAGCPYSLSAIQNGILRGNQRPPFNLTKPFGLKDKRFKVAFPYAEPLIHFALVYGTRSGPSLHCYSPGDIDCELMESARNFLRGGGLIVDVHARVAYASKILKWFSVDFGKSEVEVLKHASNYLEPTKSEALLELLANTQLKVIYQPYDWGLNC